MTEDEQAYPVHAAAGNAGDDLVPPVQAIPETCCDACGVLLKDRNRIDVYGNGLVLVCSGDCKNYVYRGDAAREADKRIADRGSK